MSAILRGVRLDADRLNRELARRGMTGRDLARRADVSEHLISRARHGARISPETLSRIDRVLSEVKPLPGAIHLGVVGALSQVGHQ